MEDKMLSIPYVIWEAEKEREAKRHKREFVMRIIIVIIMLLNNLAWLIAWSQYEYTYEDDSVVVDGGERGFAGYIGNNGDINYGESDSN